MLDLTDWFVLVLVEPLIHFNIGVPNFLILYILSTSQLSSKNLYILMLSRSAACDFYFPPQIRHVIQVHPPLKLTQWQPQYDPLQMGFSSPELHSFQVILVNGNLISRQKVSHIGQRKVIPEHFFLRLGVEHEHIKCINRGCLNDLRVSDGYIKLSFVITCQIISCIDDGQGQQLQDTEHSSSLRCFDIIFGIHQGGESLQRNLANVVIQIIATI